MRLTPGRVAGLWPEVEALPGTILESSWLSELQISSRQAHSLAWVIHPSLCAMPGAGLPGFVRDEVGVNLGGQPGFCQLRRARASRLHTSDVVGGRGKRHVWSWASLRILSSCTLLVEVRELPEGHLYPLQGCTVGPDPGGRHRHSRARNARGPDKHKLLESPQLFLYGACAWPGRG